MLSPLLAWCGELSLPPLPIIVVRRADGLPSGGYDPATIASETGRVFDLDWTVIAPPKAADLARFAIPRLPAAIRGAPQLAGALPC